MRTGILFLISVFLILQASVIGCDDDMKVGDYEQGELEHGESISKYLIGRFR